MVVWLLLQVGPAVVFQRFPGFGHKKLVLVAVQLPHALHKADHPLAKEGIVHADQLIQKDHAGHGVKHELGVDAGGGKDREQRFGQLSKLLSSDLPT